MQCMAQGRGPSLCVQWHTGGGGGSVSPCLLQASSGCTCSTLALARGSFKSTRTTRTHYNTAQLAAQRVAYDHACGASHTRVPACTPCTNPSRPPSPGLHVHVCMCGARHIQCSGSHASTADWWQVTRKPLQAYHAVGCLHPPTAPGGGAARVQLCTCAVNSLARSPFKTAAGCHWQCSACATY